MSYQVLARKWRPQSFKDMVGQEHILRMLTNALEQKRLHHAYLLTGTRGVGKTTLARILAKCLNCDTGITSTPCEKCHTCLAINSGQFLDLFEIDAASRTKVEDTRELLDNVPYPPTQGRYKIYLIDEVHMLSNHSFNALLKTLEEPPEHVKFLLATTDPKKLPVTVLSRCLQFHLKRILPEQIAKHLGHICEVEKISAEASALDKIAKAADGSMRDALSLLDQAIAYGHGAVTKNEVNAMIGSMAQEDLIPLLEALAAQDGKMLFDVIGQLAEHAPDFQQLLEEMISLFHRLAVVQIVPEAMKLEDGIAAFAKRFSAEEVQLYYQIALLGRRDLGLAPSPKQGFEMAMIRMLAFRPGQEVSLESTAVGRISLSDEAASCDRTAHPCAVRSESEIRPTAVLSKETSSPLPLTNKSNESWADIIPVLGFSGMGLAFAQNCSMVELSETKMELMVSSKHAPMLNPKMKERMIEAISAYFKKPMQLNITISSEELVTPAKQQMQEKKQQLASATQNIMQDPQVKKLIEMYDATVDVSLIS